MGLLFPELNEQKTLANVSNYFKKDLDRLLLMSGHNLTDLSSPKLSFSPSHTNYLNNAESNIIRGIDAEAMVEATYDAIHHCSYNSQIILIELFIKRKSWEQVKPLVYSEHHKFSYLRIRAMLEFADCFDHWQRECNCKPIIDLHVYD